MVFRIHTDVSKGHIQIDRPKYRRSMKDRVFAAQTQILSASATQILLEKFIESLVQDGGADRVALVGQGVIGDVEAILYDPGKPPQFKNKNSV